MLQKNTIKSWSAIVASVLLVGFLPSAASGSSVNLTFPSATTEFTADTFQSVATVTGVTPSVSGGVGGNDYRVTISASNSGLLRLAKTETDLTVTSASIAAARSYVIDNFDADSNGLGVISFTGEISDLNYALGFLEFKKTLGGTSSIEVSISEGTGITIGNRYYDVVVSSSDWETAAF